MKQAENTVIIEGMLIEVNIHEDTNKNTKMPFISGEVKVRVPLEMDGTVKELEIPVRVYANRKTTKGLDNPAYDTINDIRSMASLASVGGDVDKADWIRFENANVYMNEFYGRNGNLVSYPVIRGTFHRKLRRDEATPTASFSNIIVVGGMKEETDREGNLTGRLIVKGILPQYGDKVDVVDYVVASEAAIKHISTYWQKGDTVRVAGIANFSYITEPHVVEMGFGEPEVRKYTRSVTELIVTKGSQGALDEEFSYDNEEITKALNERQARLTEMKNNTEAKTKAVAAKTTTDFGF